MKNQIVKKIGNILSVMIGSIVLLVIIGGACAFIHNAYRHFIPEHPEPPTGWGIACDGNGHYAVIRPNGLIDDVQVFRSRQSCVNEAWETKNWHEYFQAHPAPVYQFKECGK